MCRVYTPIWQSVFTYIPSNHRVTILESCSWDYKSGLTSLRLSYVGEAIKICGYADT